MASVTNQDLQVATTSSGLNEQTIGATCVNLTPAKNAPAPFPNAGILSTATEHSSPKTQFANGQVVRVGDAVGPPTTPAHPNTGGGVVSGTYIQEARATSGSPNVKVEAKPPARDTDPTTQNHGNTTGKLIDPAAAAALAKAEQEKLKRCSLKEIKAVCSHKARPVGPTRILEVIASPASPEKITYDATRTNAVEPGDPVCALGSGKHTKWIISRKKGGGLDVKTEERAGDKMVLENSWLCKDMAPVNLGTSGTSKAVGDERAAAVDKASQSRADAQKSDVIKDRSRDIRGLDSQVGGQERTNGISRGAAKEQARQEWKDGPLRDQTVKKESGAIQSTATKVAAGMQLANQAVNLTQFLKIWYWRKDPVRVNVQALACTGSQNTEILAFPAESIDFKVGQAEYELLQATFERIKKFADFFGNLGRTLGGVNVSFQIKFMEDPEVGVEMAWKELERDAPKAGLKAYQCNKEVKVVVNIKTIVGLTFDISVSAAVFLNGVMPGSGWIVQKCCDYFGIEAKVGIKLDLAMGIGLNLTWDEYEEKVTPSCKLTFKCELFFYVRIRFRTNLIVEGSAGLSWNPSFSSVRMDKDAVVAFKLDEGDVRVGFKGMVYVSVLWWEKNESGEWWPESWRYKYAETWLRPLAPVMAMIKS